MFTLFSCKKKKSVTIYHISNDADHIMIKKNKSQFYISEKQKIALILAFKKSCTMEYHFSVYKWALIKYVSL